MKHNAIFLTLLCPMILSSCLFEENDFFEESASERIEADMKHAAEVLEGAADGWLVKYFPHPQQEFGGFNMFFKFEDGWVTVASELEDASATTKSLYSIGQESGPTLQIDSKNEMINFFAYPRNEEGIGSSHMGMQGEYLWTIMSATPEKVVLKGLRTGNSYILTPLAAGTDWAEEMQAYKDMAAKLESRFYTASLKYDESTTIELDAISDRTGNFLYRNWEVSGHIGPEDKPEFIDVNMPYIVTKDGVELYEPVMIGNVEVSSLNYDETTEILTSDGEGRFMIGKPVPEMSDNKITVTPGQFYISIQSVRITVTDPDDEYVVKFVLPSEIEGMTDDEIMTMVCRNLLESDFMSGQRSLTVQRLYEDCEYYILAFGVDRSCYMPTTGLTKQKYTTPKAELSDYEDYKDWIGTWKVVSESSEVTGTQQEFTVSIRPRNYKDVLISGWGHTGIKDGTEIIAEWNSDGTMSMIPTPDKDEKPADQAYVDGMRRLARCRYQNKDNPTEFVQFGTAKPFFKMTFGEVPGTAVVTGEEGVSANGVNYRISSVDCWEENADGNYVYPGPAEGFEERDYGIGPYVMQKISDEYGNRPPKASEQQ